MCPIVMLPLEDQKEVRKYNKQLQLTDDLHHRSSDGRLEHHLPSQTARDRTQIGERSADDLLKQNVLQ